MHTPRTRTRSIALFAMVAALSTLLPISAQEPAPPAPAPGAATEVPVHNELRAVKRKLLDAIKTRDLDLMLQYTTPDVVVTWQNNQVCRGHDEMRKFYESMGKDAFKAYKEEPTADALTTMYGDDTGVVAGHSIGSYSLFGKDYNFNNRWTATLVKVDGKWLLASYHVSLNALDNPILNTASRTLYWALGGGTVLGLIIGLLIKRKKAS